MELQSFRCFPYHIILGLILEILSSCPILNGGPYE